MELFRIENVGIHDDFFDLGGHSLLAIKVMSRIRDVLGIDLPVLSLFENPTISSMADCLVKAGLKETPVQAVPAQVEETAQPAHKPQAVPQREVQRRMTPFYFGADDAPLFGVYSPPSGAVARQAAVLMCAPIGIEYMRTHYATRLVSGQLVRAGFHVLRFDYHGVGDSSGEVGTGQFDVWRDDIATAAGELLESSGVQDLTVVGLRMGAVLAVEALASRKIKAKCLVLWDPVVSGSAYLSTLEKMHTEAAAERRVPLKPTDELLGARFPQDLRTAIQGTDIAQRLQKVDVQKAALIVSDDLAQYASLVDSMRSRWPDAKFRSIGDAVDWESVKGAYEGRMTGSIMRAVAETVESLS